MTQTWRKHPIYDWGMSESTLEFIPRSRLQPENPSRAKNEKKEYERMKKLGVVFKSAPTKMGPATLAVFDDTCGNLIQIYQV